MGDRNPGLAADDDMVGSTVQDIGDDSDEYFQTVHSRQLATLSPTYLLPVDQDEVQVSALRLSTFFTADRPL